MERNISPTVKAAVKAFIASNAKRTYTADNGKRYVIEVEHNTERNALIVTTWGFDYEEFPLPATYQEAKRLQVSNMLDMVACRSLRGVANNLYYDIVKRANA